MSAFIDAPLDPLNCIMMMLVMNCLPLSLIEDPYFRLAIDRTAKAGATLNLVSRPTLRRLLIKKHAAMKAELVSHLKQRRAPVSLVLDGWTNVNHNKVTNILLVVRNRAFYWCSINNTFDRNTAVWLATALQPIILGIESLGIPVVSFVADNEEVMSATHRQLEPEFGALLRIPCAAHTIQLIVKYILREAPFAELLKEYVDMLNLFSSKKMLRLALENAQPSSNTARRIIRPCETRWSYTLLSIDRSIKLQHYIGQALQSLGMPPKSAVFWGQLAEIAAILRPFADATDVVQRDNAVLWDVAEQFASLVDHAAKITESHPALGVLIQGHINDEWTSHHVHTSATAACGLLSRKAGHEKLISPADNIKAQQFIVDWGAKYLDHYQPFSFRAGPIREALDAQLVHFSNNSNHFEVINFHKRLSIVGAVEAWNSMLNAVPELAHVAVALLSVCASEAAVERSFSLQDRIHSKTRNRSGDDLVEAQMFIKFNAGLLKSDVLQTVPRGQPTAAEELSLEGSDKEAKPLVLLFLEDAPVAAAAPVPLGILPDPAVPVNDVDVDSFEDDQKDDPDSVAEAAAAALPEIIATAEEEDDFLKEFVKTNNIKPNAKGKVTIIGDLENKLSNEVERSRPKIKTQLKDLKKRLIVLSRSV
jgi:hypothetical protein